MKFGNGSSSFLGVVRMRLALLVAYDGTPYRGWTDVRDTALRPALATVLGLAADEPPLVQAASRTDAGVHANGQVCSLALSEGTKEVDCGQLAYSLNQLLPAEVAVRSVRLVDPSFDVRSNVGKTYLYRLSTRAGSRDPLRRLYEWHLQPRRGRPLWDASAVVHTAKSLRGTHSFAAYGNRPRGGERDADVDPMCSLRELSIRAEGDDAWLFTLSGDRFLYKMARNLVGALVRVGSGELTSEELVEALHSGGFERGASTPLTAPAHGLVLEQVDYASDPFGEAAPAS